MDKWGDLLNYEIQHTAKDKYISQIENVNPNITIRLRIGGI